MKKTYLKIKHWFCKVGLCNLDKCKCDCHEEVTTGLANPIPHEEPQKKESLPPQNVNIVKTKKRRKVIGEWERRHGITE